PASAIYGADALTGVVNIILKAPGETASSVSSGFGDGGTYRYSGVLSGRSDAGINWTFSSNYERTEAFSLSVDPDRNDQAELIDDPEISIDNLTVGGDISYRRKGWSFDAGSRVTDGRVTFITNTETLREVLLPDVVFAQTHARVQSPYGLSLRTFWNYLSTGGIPLENPPNSIDLSWRNLITNVVDVELVYQSEFDFLFEQNFSAGASYRLKTINYPLYIPEEQSQDHFAVFFEDNIKFNDRIRLLLSGRADRHPLIDELQLSPRAALIVRPSDTTSIRAVAGRAFRGPTLIESYVNNPVRIPNSRGAVAFGVGNEELDPENLVSFELGFIKEIVGTLTLEASVYFNRFNNTIEAAAARSPTLGDNNGFNDQFDGFEVGTVGFVNNDFTLRQLGGELGIRLFPVEGLDVYANYAIHDTSPEDEEDPLLDGREVDQRTSRHKINAGLQYRSKFGVDLGVDLHYASSQVWALDEGTAGTVGFSPFPIDGYTIVNGRVGYRLPGDQIEVSLEGTNLLEGRHRQHPLGQLVDRRIFLSASLRL
ncbi:MAG: TonB-dependent receptor, partial [Myxococcota bacterium]